MNTIEPKPQTLTATMNQQYTPEEVAKRLNVPRHIVHALIRDGKLFAKFYSRKTIRVPEWSISDYEKAERLFRIPVKSANIVNHRES